MASKKHEICGYSEAASIVDWVDGVDVRSKARCPKSTPKEVDNEGALPLHWVPGIHEMARLEDVAGNA